MSPRWGRDAGGSQTPPPRSSHPAGGGDWAQGLDWTDPRGGEQREARPGLGARLRRFGAGGRPPAPNSAPRRRRGRKIAVRRVVALTLLALVVFAGWFLFELYQPLAGGGGAPVTVSIPPGSSGSSVGTLLAKDGVVSSSFFFKLRASLAGDSGKFRAGVYTLKHGMSYGAALSALVHQAGGGAAEISLTIPPGLTRAQIAVLAHKAGLRGNYMKASTAKAAGFSPQRFGAHKGVTSLEGFLFPDTYFIYRGGWVSSLVQKQLAAFQQNFVMVKLGYAKSRNLTDYDVITIASIIEREARLTSDGPKVSAVIYNRLRESIPLGLDTTLLYYLHDPKHGNLTSKQLELPTRYNTRLHFGLPPTPISNPGLPTLDAAAHPSADQQVLYFVVKPNACGALAFADDQAVFNKDVAAYRAAVAVDHGRLPDGCPK